MRPDEPRTEREFVWNLGKRSEILLARWSVSSHLAFAMLTIIFGGFFFNLNNVAILASAFFIITYFFGGKIVVYPDKIFIPKTLLSGKLINFKYIDKVIVGNFQRHENSLPLPVDILFLYDHHVNYLNLTNFFMDQGCRNFIKLLNKKTLDSSFNIVDIENVDSETVQKIKHWKEEHNIFSSKRLFISGFSILIGFLAGILPATENEFFNTLNIKIFGNTPLPPLIFLSLLVFSLILWTSRENFFVGIGVRQMLILTYSENEPDKD